MVTIYVFIGVWGFGSFVSILKLLQKIVMRIKFSFDEFEFWKKIKNYFSLNKKIFVGSNNEN